MGCLPRRAPNRPRGVALMTGLLLSVFVLLLSMSLLGMVENDNHFLSEREYDMRAYAAAESGLEVYRVASLSLTAGGPPLTGTVDSPAGAVFVQNWSVRILATGDVKSTGTVVNGTRTLAAHTVIVPSGDFAGEYDHVGP